MDITPKAMEIEYIRIKRFMQQGPIYCYFHNNPKCSRTFIVELLKKLVGGFLFDEIKKVKRMNFSSFKANMNSL